MSSRVETLVLSRRVMVGRVSLRLVTLRSVESRPVTFRNPCCVLSSQVRSRLVVSCHVRSRCALLKSLSCPVMSGRVLYCSVESSHVQSRSVALCLVEILVLLRCVQS
jgi:hypothetical protein